MSVIDLTKDFELKKLVNLSKRLITEMNYTNLVFVTIEKDELADLGSSIVLVDPAAKQTLKINPDKLKKYYEQD